LREKVQDDEKGPDEVTRQLKLCFFLKRINLKF
jgi:hypothetical protein